MWRREVTHLAEGVPTCRTGHPGPSLPLPQYCTPAGVQGFTNGHSTHGHQCTALDRLYHKGGGHRRSTCTVAGAPTWAACIQLATMIEEGHGVTTVRGGYKQPTNVAEGAPTRITGHPDPSLPLLHLPHTSPHTCTCVLDAMVITHSQY